MTQDQFTKASNIIARKDRLSNALIRVEKDLETIKSKSSYSEFDLQNTSLTLYRDDVIILLSTRHAWLIAEIQFLEKQLALI